MWKIKGSVFEKVSKNWKVGGGGMVALIKELFLLGGCCYPQIRH